MRNAGLLVTILACLACGPPQGEDGPGSGSGPDAWSGGGGGGGPNEFSDAAEERSCRFVDLLFVVDNSPSMREHQEALVTVWPAFVDAMYDRLPMGTDLHVGITTTSFFSGSCAESTINCRSGATPGDIAAHYLRPTEGTTGINGEQGRLFEYQGLRYFAADTGVPDRAPLTSWFSGAGVAAGELGCSFEMSSAGAGYAAHPANAAVNEGFFRDEDAVLVVIILSDEPDKSPEGPEAYHDMIVDLKAGCGGDECVVAAGILDPCTIELDDPVVRFLRSFGREPLLGEINDHAGYAGVVGDALAGVVDETCDLIVIPD
jgi:hypothetical protein